MAKAEVADAEHGEKTWKIVLPRAFKANRPAGRSAPSHGTKQKNQRSTDSTYAINPSVPVQLSNPQDQYIIWVEHAARAPRVGNCLPI
jgi:hypothetical protein